MMSASSTLPPTHVALLDDHKLFRQGIVYILQRLPYVASITEVATFTELQEAMRQRLPDVLLLDLQMPQVNGMEATKLLLSEHPDLKIIVLTMHSAEHFIVHMFKLGVRSYLPKEIDQEQLGKAIEAVLTDGHYFTAAASKAIAQGLSSGTRSKPSLLIAPVVLTARETEVLHLLCKGYTTSEIAQQLFLSNRTVDGHRQSLLDKTNTHNSVSLVLYAMKHSLLADKLDINTFNL